MNEPKIALALDGQSANSARRLTNTVGRLCHAVKIHDLLDSEGPYIHQRLKDVGARLIWVDYKLHDTKDTVALRVKALVKNGARIITVHASGGVPMMEEAVEAAAGRCEIWAITLLTSLDDTEIGRIYGTERTRSEIVHELVLMGKEAGVNGIVCSALEVGLLANSPQLDGLELAVPGTRSAGVALGQQKRSGTPQQAIADGATLLVAGSQVTKATDPLEALTAMATEAGITLEEMAG